MIKGFILYGHGTVEIHRSFGNSPNSKPPTRGSVGMFTKRARARLALVATEANIDWKALLTVTYPKEFGRNGEKVKDDLAFVLRVIKQYYIIPPNYLWVLEFQKRGAPHFHIMLDKEPLPSFRAYFAWRWADFIGKVYGDFENVLDVHLHSKTLEKIRQTDGAKKYLMKYALKSNQKEVPKEYMSVGRFWGCNKGVIDAIPKPVYIRAENVDIKEFLVSVNPRVGDWTHLPRVIFRTLPIEVKEIVGKEVIDDLPFLDWRGTI